MAKHTQVRFNNLTAEKTEELIALLSELGFDGFEERDNDLLAYIPQTDALDFDWALLSETWNLDFEKQDLEERNWNAEWESNFKPVFVEDFLCIRADFHPPATGVQLELLITPKMSFGTGHHATTWLTTLAMRDLHWSDEVKSVFDFGTGTGVLAILAEKLGADEVEAIDNDSWSIENAKENLERNKCSRVTIALADRVDPIGKKFDLILANINKHIILENLPALASRLQKNGVLLLSGLLSTDEADISLAASIQGLAVISRMERDNWLCLRLSASRTQ